MSGARVRVCRLSQHEVKGAELEEGCSFWAFFIVSGNIWSNARCAVERYNIIFVKNMLEF